MIDNAIFLCVARCAKHVACWTRYLLVLYMSLSVSVVSAQNCNLQQVTPAKFKPSVDRVMWGNDPVALIEGVSFDDDHQVNWAGPVVSVKPDGSERCKADVENLMPPFVLANGRYFYFVSGDAIDFRVQVIDLNDCQLKWQTKAYDWGGMRKAEYKHGRFLVGKNKYVIPQDCLIGRSSEKQKTH